MKDEEVGIPADLFYYLHILCLDLPTSPFS